MQGFVGLTYCTHIFSKKLIINDNLEISNVALTVLIPLETNGITVDLDVLPEAITERKYFKGQVPENVQSNKCDLFFYHQNFQIKR